MNEIDPQEFGRLQAQVETLIASDRLKTDLLATMNATLQAMQVQMAEARGGWKVLMLLGGASASVGGLITWFATHLLGRGAP